MGRCFVYRQFLWFKSTKVSNTLVQNLHRFSVRGRDSDQIFTKQAVVNPTNTFYSVKRFIGRKMSEVEDESKQVSYKVMRDPNGNVKLECPVINKQFAAEEISAQVRSIKLPLS
jgi:molecular chaperone DnaK (HSP70)